MRKVIEDWDQFHAFLAAQPFIRWSVEKQRDIAAGVHHHPRGSAAPAAPKDDNAELAAALAAMA